MEAEDSGRHTGPGLVTSCLYMGSTVIAPLARHMSWLSSCSQSAPPPLCPSSRTPDLKALLNVVDNARSFIYIAVMNYLPTMEFSHPHRYCWEHGQGLGHRATKRERGVGEGAMGPRKQAGGAKTVGQMEGKPWGEADGTEKRIRILALGSRDGELEA